MTSFAGPTISLRWQGAPAVLHWKVHAGKTRVFYVPAKPTRVELTRPLTFSPYEFGGSDRRELGAQVSEFPLPRSVRSSTLP